MNGAAKGFLPAGGEELPPSCFCPFPAAALGEAGSWVEEEAKVDIVFECLSSSFGRGLFLKTFFPKEKEREKLNLRKRNELEQSFLIVLLSSTNLHR